MSMREKMARAMCDAEYVDSAVDAALDALMEPTEEMYEALSATSKLWRDLDSQTVWQTYIRAAKEGK